MTLSRRVHDHCVTQPYTSRHEQKYHAGGNAFVQTRNKIYIYIEMYSKQTHHYANTLHISSHMKNQKSKPHIQFSFYRNTDNILHKYYHTFVIVWLDSCSSLLQKNYASRDTFVIVYYRSITQVLQKYYQS